MPTSRSQPDSDDPASRLATWRGRVRRRFLVHRRWLAAAMAGLAVLLALHDLRPADAATAPVWTAARDLAGGETLTSADLARTAYPPPMVPDGAVRDASRLLGRTVAAPVRRGQPLTDLAVVGSTLTGAEEGRVAVPVRIQDGGIVALVHVGDRLDLVAVDPDTSRPPTLVATSARVLAVPAPGEAGLSGDAGGRLLVVSVSPQEATPVAAAGMSQFLTVTFSP